MNYKEEYYIDEDEYYIEYEYLDWEDFFELDIFGIEEDED